MAAETAQWLLPFPPVSEAKMANRFLLLLVTAALFLVGQVRAEIADVVPVGDLERWGVLSLGLNGPGNRLADDAFIQGDFGAAGISRLALTDTSFIEGDLYYRHHGVIRIAPGSGIIGSQFRDQDALLEQETADALTFTRAAGALTANRDNDRIKLSGSDSLTLTGAPGETVVLSLRSFAMSGDSTLNLTGAANTTFVINVKNGFSLMNAARIVLSGGLDWNDVVFNVRHSGAEIQISGTADLEGILLAARRTVRLRDSALVRGEVIADALLMRGVSQILHPPVVSP
jgi:choice-of-anchor A domain-containing protein